MKKNYFRIAFVLTTISLGSCQVTFFQDSKHRENATEPIRNAPIYPVPLLVDMEVDFSKRITGTASGELDGIYTVDYYKEQATSQAIVTAGCDVLYEPVYSITTTYARKAGKMKGNVEVQVSGYAAKYKNARNIKDSDTTLLKMMYIMQPVTPATNNSLINTPLRVKSTKIY